MNTEGGGGGGCVSVFRGEVQRWLPVYFLGSLPSLRIVRVLFTAFPMLSGSDENSPPSLRIYPDSYCFYESAYLHGSVQISWGTPVLIPTLL
jgi:hypothetical protein